MFVTEHGFLTGELEYLDGMEVETSYLIIWGVLGTLETWLTGLRLGEVV